MGSAGNGCSWPAARGSRSSRCDPTPLLTSVGSAVSNSTLIGGAAAILCAMLMAIAMARSLSRPLVQITRAVEGFGRGELIKVKPGGGTEIAVLAETFLNMSAEAQRKTAALNDEIAARSHVAEMLNNTITNMADPVVIADAGGNVVLTNLAAAKLFGRPTGYRQPAGLSQLRAVLSRWRDAAAVRAIAAATRVPGRDRREFRVHRPPARLRPHAPI